jgi:pSer/pThr/pTyr-binding forkhead associated (FHA) protein
MDEQTMMASGWSGANLVVLQGAQAGTSFPLPRTPVILGREEGVGISVRDPEMSRRHGRISWQEGSFVVEDLGSTNGTILNGVPITGPQRLRPGDTIGMGQTLFEFQWQAAAAPVQPKPAQAMPPQAAPAQAIPAQAMPPQARGGPAYYGPMPAAPPAFAPVAQAPHRRRNPWLMWGCGCVVVLVLAVVAAGLTIEIFRPDLFQPIQPYFDRYGIPIQLSMLQAAGSLG